MLHKYSFIQQNLNDQHLQNDLKNVLGEEGWLGTGGWNFFCAKLGNGKNESRGFDFESPEPQPAVNVRLEVFKHAEQIQREREKEREGRETLMTQGL